MAEKYDVIISGAGIGGLFAAAKLAKHKKKVLLIEQHFIAGGYATSFKRKGFTFEAGIHALDNIGPGTINAKIFDEFDLLKKSELIRLPEFYTVVRDDLNLTIPDNYKKAEEVLTSQFPQEKKAIHKFIKIVNKIHEEVLKVPSNRWKMLSQIPLMPFKFPHVLRHFFDTLDSFLNRSFKNDDLKLLLSGNTGYYHTNPAEYSALHYGGAQGSYLSGGAYFLKGGSERLIKQLTDYITENGGEFRFNSEVVEFTSDSGKAVNGVKYKTKKGEIIEVKADAIVGNNAIPSIIEMLPNKLSKKLSRKFGKYTISHSLFVVYVGMKKPLKKLGNESYAIFSLPSELKRLKDMGHYNTTDDFSKKILSIVDYSLVKNELSLDDEHEYVCAIAVIDDIKKWENLSREDYLRMKEEKSNILINRMENVIPGFKENLEFYESATPVTFKRYTLNPTGCIYGYAQTLGQIGPKRPENYSGISNLYFASAWSKPGGGMTPSAKCGYNAAVAILKKTGDI